MKNTLLYSSLIIGLALVGCNKSTKTTTTASDYSTTPTADQVAADARNAANNAADDMRRATNNAADNIRSGVNAAGNAISDAATSVANTARMTEWRLNATDIQADIDAKREIVRTRENVGAPTGTMDKSTLKAAVEGRIRADSELSAFKIDVDPGANGEINLDGEVNSSAQVGKAIALALDTDGVTRVKSKIEVDKNARANRR
jgi:osmotically-inducible protein OsmY